MPVTIHDSKLSAKIAPRRKLTKVTNVNPEYAIRFRHHRVTLSRPGNDAVNCGTSCMVVVTEHPGGDNEKERGEKQGCS
jgi:hypothetical protein